MAQPREDFTLMRMLSFVSFDRSETPKGEFFAEANRLFIGQVGGFLSLRLRAELTLLLIHEVGRAAIDAHSGRLRLASEELRIAARAENEAAKEDLVGPVRILLVGQVNGGKSSLLNAMAQQVHRAVGPIPTSDDAKELVLKFEGRPEVVLIDTPGVASDLATSRILVRQSRNSGSHSLGCLGDPTGPVARRRGVTKNQREIFGQYGSAYAPGPLRGDAYR